MDSRLQNNELGPDNPPRNNRNEDLLLDNLNAQNHESTTNEVLTHNDSPTNRRLQRQESANHNYNFNEISNNRNQYQNNPANEELSHEETNRRRLYLNLGRPRPFYREQMTR